MDKKTLNSFSLTNTFLRRKFLLQLRKQIEIKSKKDITNFLEGALAPKDLIIGSFDIEGGPVAFSNSSLLSLANNDTSSLPYDLFGGYHLATELHVKISADSWQSLKTTEQMQQWKDRMAFNSEDAEAYHHPLIALLSLMPNLETLKVDLKNVSQCLRGPVYHYLASWNRNLSTLSLETMAIGDDHLNLLLQHLPNLQFLSVNVTFHWVFGEESGVEAAQELAKNLAACHCLKNLEIGVLEVAYIPIPLIMLDTLFNEFGKLTEARWYSEQSQLKSLHLLMGGPLSASVFAKFLCSPMSAKLQSLITSRDNILPQQLHTEPAWKEVCEGKHGRNCFFGAETDIKVDVQLLSPAFVKKIGHRIKGLSFLIEIDSMNQATAIVESASMGLLPRLKVIYLLGRKSMEEEMQMAFTTVHQYLKSNLPQISIII